MEQNSCSKIRCGWLISKRAKEQESDARFKQARKQLTCAERTISWRLVSVPASRKVEQRWRNRLPAYLCLSRFLSMRHKHIWPVISLGYAFACVSTFFRLLVQTRIYRICTYLTKAFCYKEVSSRLVKLKRLGMFALTMNKLFCFYHWFKNDYLFWLWHIFEFAPSKVMSDCCNMDSTQWIPDFRSRIPDFPPVGFGLEKYPNI